MKRFSALIVDDEPLAREGLRLLLTGDPQVVTISEAKNGREAVSAIREGRPDLPKRSGRTCRRTRFRALRWS